MIAKSLSNFVKTEDQKNELLASVELKKHNTLKLQAERSHWKNKINGDTKWTFFIWLLSPVILIGVVVDVLCFERKVTLKIRRGIKYLTSCTCCDCACCGGEKKEVK